MNTVHVKPLIKGRSIEKIMKKEIVLTLRINSEMDQIIRSLAESDDRTVAWMARKLIEEALVARNLLKPKEKG